MCPASLGQKSNSGFLSGVSHLLFKGSVCVCGGVCGYVYEGVCTVYVYASACEHGCPCNGGQSFYWMSFVIAIHLSI